VLQKLKKYEAKSATSAFEHDTARIRSYWPDFLASACNSFETEEAEFDPLMERIQRTGFYATNTEPTWANDLHIGKTTRQFEKLWTLVSRNP
jgi:hypothetical protein